MSWFSPCTWTWPRESISNDAGMADVAYVALFMVAGSVMGAIAAMTAMSAVAYFRCHAFQVGGVWVNCTYDPQPLGIAIGAACGGLATALGALAGYMVATRAKPAPQAPQTPVATTTTTTETTLQPQPAEAATEVEAASPRARKGKR